MLHYITLHSLHHHKCNCNYSTLITLHHTYNSTTLQLQLQLHYTTLRPAVVGEVTDQVTTATIAATPKNTAPTTFRSISGFALPFRDSQQPSSPIGFLFLKLPPPACAVLLVIEGSLEVKLPTTWTDEKQRWEESEKRGEERERVRRKKIQVRQQVGKSQNTVFPMIWSSGGSKSRLAKAAGAEPAGQMRD